MLRSEISIKRIDHGEVSLLHLSGDLAKQESQQLKSYIETMIDASLFQIILDMEEIRFVDSYAMMILLRLNRECISGGGEIKLLRPRAVVKRFMSINQILELFDCYETKIDTINSFKTDHNKTSPSFDSNQLVGKQQQLVIQRLIEILIKKGYFDHKAFDHEFQSATQMILEIYKKELNSSQ